MVLASQKRKRKGRKAGYRSRHLVTLPETTPEYAEETVEDLIPTLAPVVEHSRLYRHQAQTIKYILRFLDILLLAGTGAGKTEAVIYAFLELLLTGKITHVILFYPTKDLARDQKIRLQVLLNRIREQLGIILTCAAYHGDTHERTLQKIERDPPHILIATFDKIFYRLAQDKNPEFKDYLLRAGLIWVDEIHDFTGLLGAHLKYFLQNYHRVNPKVIVVLTSATGGDPETLKEQFSPAAELVLGGTRRGTIQVRFVPREDLYPLLHIQLERVRAIPGAVLLVFVDSIREAEHHIRALQVIQEVQVKPAEVMDQDELRAIARFQAGEEELEVSHGDLPKKERHEGFQRLKTGMVKLVIATSGLEKGIDIPAIAAVVNIGYPLTGKNGLLQRIGRLRAGSGEMKDFFLVLGEDRGVEGYYYANQSLLAEQITRGETETVHIAEPNLEALQTVLLHAPFLGEVTREELTTLVSEEVRPLLGKALTGLLAEGLVTFREGFFEHVNVRQARRWLHEHNLRGVIPKWTIKARLVDQTQKAYTIDWGKIPHQALPGNKYKLEGRTFLIQEVDEDKKTLHAQEIPAEIEPGLSITQNEVDVRVAYGRHSKQVEKGDITIECGPATVVIQPEARVTYTGEEKVRVELKRTEQREFTFETEVQVMTLTFGRQSAIWRLIPYWQRKEALGAVADALVLAVQRQYGISGSQFHTEVNSKARWVALLDRSPQVKLTSLVFDSLSMLVKAILQGIKTCECRYGCPRCIGLPQYGTKFHARKQLVRILLEGLQ